MKTLQKLFSVAIVGCLQMSGAISFASVCPDLSGRFADCSETHPIFDGSPTGGTRTVRSGVSYLILNETDSRGNIVGYAISARLGESTENVRLSPACTASSTGTCLVPTCEQHQGVDAVTFKPNPQADYTLIWKILPSRDQLEVLAMSRNAAGTLRKESQTTCLRRISAD
jgi:hypothetical protein